jgi:signal transduction histidine kinase
VTAIKLISQATQKYTEAIGNDHFGLESIRQRARLLGGRLTIESKPGSGTLVQMVVPILEKQIEE